MTYDELQCFHYDFDLITLLLKATALTLIFFLLASKCNQVQYEENEPKSENEKSSGVPNPNRTIRLTEPNRTELQGLPNRTEPELEFLGSIPISILHASTDGHHPSTNRARCSVTTSIETYALPLDQATI